MKKERKKQWIIYYIIDLYYIITPTFTLVLEFHIFASLLQCFILQHSKPGNQPNFREFLGTHTLYPSCINFSGKAPNCNTTLAFRFFNKMSKNIDTHLSAFMSGYRASQIISNFTPAAILLGRRTFRDIQLAASTASRLSILGPRLRIPPVFY